MGLKRIVSAGSAFAGEGSELDKSPFVPLFQRGKTGGLLRTIPAIPIILLTAVAAFADNGTEWGVMDDFTVFGTTGTWPDADVEIKGYSVFGDTSSFTPSVVKTGTGSVVIGGELEVGGSSYFMNNVGISTGDPNGLLNVRDLFIVKPDGNVGIGTNVPGSRLEVAGGSITIRGSDGNFAIVGFADASGNYRVVISTTGNVGVGTASPEAKLTVVGNTVLRGDAQAGLLIDAAGGGEQNVWIGDYNTPSNKAGIYLRSVADSYIRTAGAALHLYPTAAETDGMTILSNGNVGIGTTNPDAGAKLTVAGGILATAPFLATTGSTAGMDYYAGELRLFAIGTSGATKGAYQFIAKGADNSQTIPMTIDNNGNVGIGITNPDTKLVVSGDIKATNFYSTAYSAYLIPNSVNGNYWQPSGSDIYRGTGRVGIGTTGPSQPLHISAVDAVVRLTSTGGTDWDLHSRAGDSSFRITPNPFTTPSMTILPTTGNVGIGTTAPWGTLVVINPNSEDPSLTHQTASVTSFGTLNSVELSMGQAVASPWAWWMQTRHFLNDGSSYPLSINPLGGNVGIGTTGPASKLEVSGKIRAYNGNASAITAAYAATSGNTIEFQPGNDGAVSKIYSSYWNTEGDLVLGTYSNQANQLYLSKSGNVGIGTTSPITKFQVVGLPEYTDNTAATNAGLTVGAFYRTGDVLKVVH